MKHLWWLCACVLLACLGCTNDLAHEKTGTVRSAGSIGTITFTQSVAATNLYEPFTLTWTYALPVDGKPAGYVSLYDTTTDSELSSFDVTPETLDHSVSVSLYSPGDHHIEARYYLSREGSPIDTQSVVHRVTLATETTVSAASPVDVRQTTFVFGEMIRVRVNVTQPPIVSAAVANEQEPPAPSGSVKLTYGANLDLGTCDVQNGSSTCDVTGLPVGSERIIHAEFLPSAQSYFSPSAGNANPLTITKASTSSLVASATPEPSLVDGTVTFSVEVHPVSPSTAAPSGQIQLFRSGDASPAATVTLVEGSGKSTATIPISSGTIVAPAGIKNIHAVYVPSSDFNASTSPFYVHTVSLDATAGALTASPAPNWKYGEPIKFTMTVTSDGATAAPTGAVLFYDGPVSPTSYIGIDTVHDRTGNRGVATLTTSALALGDHSITAVYGGDPTHASVSAVLSGNVAKAKPTVELTVLPSSAVYSQPVNFGARVVGGGSTPPTGTVQFYVNGSTPIGPAVAVVPGTGVASHIDASLDVADDRPITAVYSGDTRYASATSAQTFLTITLEPTGTSLTTSSQPATAGGSVVLTASVSKLGFATATPKGKVKFTEGSTVLGDVSVNASGIATLTLPTPVAATRDIHAAFTGDANFGNSSDGLTQNVVAAGVTTTLTASPNPSLAGQNVTFTATFTSSTAGPATGTVTFLDGSSALGSATLASGVATLSTSTLAPGVHTIKVDYAGDASHAAGSVTIVQTVSRIASATTLTTTAPDTTELGAAVPLKATVTSSSGVVPTGVVSFRDGATVLGTVALDAAGAASFNASALGVGPHVLSVAYAGDGLHHPSTSTNLAHTIDKAVTSLVVVSSLSPSPLGFNVLFSATLTGGQTGSAAPTGAISFRDGLTVIGSGTINSSGVAQLATSTLAAGPHTITATYAGDTRFLGATSAPITQSVSASAAAMAISSSPNPSALGGSVTITVNLSGGSGVPTGIVTFKQGTTTLGTGTLDASGKATFSTATLPSGTLTLTADYPGDGTYDPATASVPHVVQRGSTTTALAASATSATPGTALTFTASVSSSTGVVSGDVELFDATTSLGSTTLAAGSAAFSIASLSAGPHAITAQFKGSGSFTSSISNTIIVTIGAGTSGGADGGADGGGTTSGGVGSSSSSSGSSPGTGTADGGSAIGASGGLEITPGGGSGGGDDCAMTPGGTGTLTVPVLVGLIAVLARRRRKFAA